MGASGVKMPSYVMKLIKPGRYLPPNTIALRVPLNMNKFQIKSYLENLYGIRVLKVNTLIQLGKTRAVPYTKFHQKLSDFKKAYVRVSPQDFIKKT